MVTTRNVRGANAAPDADAVIAPFVDNAPAADDAPNPHLMGLDGNQVPPAPPIAPVAPVAPTVGWPTVGWPPVPGVVVPPPAPVPPMPLGHLLTPYGRVLELQTPGDAKLYTLACQPFTPLFDGTPESLISFADQVLNRAIELQCRDIFHVTAGTDQFGAPIVLDILTKWSSIDLSVAQTAAYLRWSTPTWHQQASYIMGKVILDSLSPSFRARLTQYTTAYLIQSYPDGPLLMKTIFGLT